jgi:hypothetical protein
MTKKQLSHAISVTVIVLGIYAVTGIGLSWFGQKPLKDNDLYTVYKDVTGPLVALLAALLGFSFQRRNSYLQALRDLWKILIPAVQGAIRYTYLDLGL